MIVTVNAKGQITIPKKIREAAGMRPGGSGDGSCIGTRESFSSQGRRSDRAETANKVIRHRGDFAHGRPLNFALLAQATC